MPQLKDYRLFISHAWKYGEDYTRLTNLLDAASNFSYYNYSAPENKPLELSRPDAAKTEIKKKITNKISPAQIILVISGMYTNNSEWMQYELDEAC
ncbi:MAG: TIR domain-containing protein [Clostridiales bacterium]|nr:TIR domain-containing protein [Clostridiales bacterium]